MEGLTPQLLLLRLLLLVLVAVLSRSGASQGQAAVLLQQRQGGVGAARPAVAGRAALHLVHSLGHRGQSGRRRVGVQARRRAEERVVG